MRLYVDIFVFLSFIANASLLKIIELNVLYVTSYLNKIYFYLLIVFLLSLIVEYLYSKRETKDLNDILRNNGSSSKSKYLNRPIIRIFFSLTFFLIVLSSVIYYRVLDPIVLGDNHFKRTETYLAEIEFSKKDELHELGVDWAEMRGNILFYTPFRQYKNYPLEDSHGFEKICGTETVLYSFTKSSNHSLSFDCYDIRGKSIYDEEIKFQVEENVEIIKFDLYDMREKGDYKPYGHRALIVYLSDGSEILVLNSIKPKNSLFGISEYEYILDYVHRESFNYESATYRKNSKEGNPDQYSKGSKLYLIDIGNFETFLFVEEGTVHVKKVDWFNTYNEVIDLGLEADSIVFYGNGENTEYLSYNNYQIRVLKDNMEHLYHVNYFLAEDLDIQIYELIDKSTD